MFAELLDKAKEAALAAGKVISSVDGSTLELIGKEAGASEASNALTEIDLKAEKAILEILNPTIEKYDLGLLTEESPDDNSRFEKEYFWCIDPLDGTLQYSKGETGYAVSIALIKKDGTVVIGVVFDPANKNLYHAIKGEGAFKNDNPFKVIESPGELNEIPIAGAVMMAINTIELAPAVFIKPPKKSLGGGCIWDYAATSLISFEAGGFNCQHNGEPFDLNPKESLYMNKVGTIFSSSKSLILSKKS